MSPVESHWCAECFRPSIHFAKLAEAFIEVIEAHPEGMRPHARAEGYVEALKRRGGVQACGKHVALSQHGNLAVLVADKVGETLAIVQVVIMVRLQGAAVIPPLPRDKWSRDECVCWAESGMELDARKRCGVREYMSALLSLKCNTRRNSTRISPCRINTKTKHQESTKQHLSPEDR
jgi:hypothetical protein